MTLVSERGAVNDRVLELADDEGLPWHVTPCAVVPMGWPIGKYGPTTRRPIGELVSLDRYGNRAFLDFQ